MSEHIVKNDLKKLLLKKGMSQSTLAKKRNWIKEQLEK